MSQIPAADLQCLGRDALFLPWTEDDTAILLAVLNDETLLDQPQAA